MIRKADRPARLASLICGSDGCYLYGDKTRTIIEARPILPPLIIAEISKELPYSLIAKSFEAITPPKANAFYLGMPVFRYEQTNIYDVAVQFCAIPTDDWERSFEFPKAERMFARGYFDE